MRYIARVGGRELQLEVTPRGGGRFTVSLDGTVREIERRGEGGLLLLTMDGDVREAMVTRDDVRPAEGGGPTPQGGAAYSVMVSGRPYSVRLLDPLRSRSQPMRPMAEGPMEVRAIMPGKVTALLVAEGGKEEAPSV